MRGHFCTKLQNRGNMRVREFPMVVLLDLCQIRRLALQRTRYRPVPFAVRAMAWSAIICIHLLGVVRIGSVDWNDYL